MAQGFAIGGSAVCFLGVFCGPRLTISLWVRLIDDMTGLGTHSTDLQCTRVQQQVNRISRKIEAWIDVQKVYMPRTTLLRARDDDRRAPGC